MVAMMHLLHHVLRSPGGKRRESQRENSNLTSGYARYKGRDDKFFNLDFWEGQ